MKLFELYLFLSLSFATEEEGPPITKQSKKNGSRSNSIDDSSVPKEVKKEKGKPGRKPNADKLKARNEKLNNEENKKGKESVQVVEGYEVAIGWQTSLLVGVEVGGGRSGNVCPSLRKPPLVEKPPHQALPSSLKNPTGLRPAKRRLCKLQVAPALLTSLAR